MRLSIAAPLALAGLMLAAAPVFAAATVYESSIVIDVTGEVVDGCDEPVLLSGELRELFHITERADGSLTIVVTTRPTGLSGVGLESGAMYRGVGATHQTFVLGAIDGSGLPTLAVNTVIDRTRIVGTAGALTLDMRLTFHVTRLDDVVVVVVDRSSVTCS